MPRRKRFRLPERVVTLFFEDGPYQGFELDMSVTVPQAIFWKIAEWADLDVKDRKGTNVAEVRDQMLLVGEQIRAWNLDDRNGTAVPATPEAFADRLDQQTQWAIIKYWLRAIAEAPVPLSPPSSDGDTSAVR